MCTDRREFLQMSALTAGVTAFTATTTAAPQAPPDPIRKLRPLPGKPASISDAERNARIEKARKLMVEKTPPHVRSSPMQASAPITKCRACRIAPGTALAWMGMNGRTSCGATKYCCNPACVLVMSR